MFTTSALYLESATVPWSQTVSLLRSMLKKDLSHPFICGTVKQLEHANFAYTPVTHCLQSQPLIFALFPDFQRCCVFRLAAGVNGKLLCKQLHQKLPYGRSLLPQQVEWVVMRIAKSLLQVQHLSVCVICVIHLCLLHAA